MHRAPDLSEWAGRTDIDSAGDARRLHQLVQKFEPSAPPAVVLLGFCCDQGVQRNGGREGAALAPVAIRKALGAMAWHAKNTTLLDWGDIVPDGATLEQLQTELEEATRSLIAAGHLPIVLGGGHEVAYGTGAGVFNAASKRATVGMLNIDSHLDLREAVQRNSGTSFANLLSRCVVERRRANYLCIGAALCANTPALFARAKSYGAEWLLDEDVYRNPRGASGIVDDFLSASDNVYLSIDMDVFPACEAPGVSAPASLGTPAQNIIPLLQVVARSERLRAVDIAELNPHFDIDGRTARLAARLIHAIIQARHT